MCSLQPQPQLLVADLTNRRNTQQQCCSHAEFHQKETKWTPAHRLRRSGPDHYFGVRRRRRQKSHRHMSAIIAAASPARRLANCTCRRATAPRTGRTVNRNGTALAIMRTIIMRTRRISRPAVLSWRRRSRRCPALDLGLAPGTAHRCRTRRAAGS